MKFEQIKKFQPLTITLETEHDANVFLTALTHVSCHQSKVNDAVNSMSKWVSSKIENQKG